MYLNHAALCGYCRAAGAAELHVSGGGGVPQSAAAGKGEWVCASNSMPPVDEFTLQSNESHNT